MGSNKNVLPPYKMATSQTLTNDFNSGTVGIGFLDNIALQIDVTTSNSTGTFSVYASMSGTANWVPLSMSGTPAVAAANDNILISLNQLPFRYLYVGYAHGTSGAGSCDITITAKEIG